LKYIALICARGGSKGLHNKNIKDLGGKPLIAWAIDTAKQVERISKIIISTDSPKIAQISENFGAEVPFIRPKELSEDGSSEWDVWRHALEFLKEHRHKIDGLVVIPPTAPLRNVQDINNCIDEYEKNQCDIVITVTKSHRSPYFNMVQIDDNDFSSIVIPRNEKIYRRQDSPEVFDMTTVAYVVKPEFVFQKNGIFEGRVKSIHIPLERAIDIDTIFDLNIAKYFLSKKA
jgi:CMP-N-acetylneuraminic acid synthetase